MNMEKRLTSLQMLSGVYAGVISKQVGKTWGTQHAIQFSIYILRHTSRTIRSGMPEAVPETTAYLNVSMRKHLSHGMPHECAQ